MSTPTTIDGGFAAFFALAPDLLAIADFEGHFQCVNPAWEQLLGYSEEDLLAQPFLAFVHPDDRERTIAESARLTVDATPQPFENRYRARDGSYRWLRWTARSDLEQNLIYAVARDVTGMLLAHDELAHAQAAAEHANQAKSEFLSRVSHELRTPLNAILGFGQLLELADELSPEHADSVRQILKAGRHQLQLIDEVLDISRIESGRLALSSEPVDLDEVLAEAGALITPLAAERAIALAPSPRTGLYVHADHQRLTQVLLNLLSNAVKYNLPGGAVTVECERLDDDQAARVTVGDTGSGIAPEHLDRLFEPFDRLDANERGIEGTGLGLALTKGLIEAMGGSIGVVSTPGHGSSFSIELPLAERPALAPAEAVRPERGALATGPRTILYIEDNLSNLTLIEKILDGQGDIRLLPAMQGSLGLDIARKHAPDLILLDLHLPDLGGEQVLAELRADERTRAIPVVVISADATPGRLQRLPAAGAQAFLTKPIDVPRFLTVVRDLLSEET